MTRCSGGVSCVVGLLYWAGNLTLGQALIGRSTIRCMVSFIGKAILLGRGCSCLLRPSLVCTQGRSPLETKLSM